MSNAVRVRLIWRPQVRSSRDSAGVLTLSDADADRHRTRAIRQQRMVAVDRRGHAQQLITLRSDMAAWVEESRAHSAAYGLTIDGRPRFDLEPGHTDEQPALRRVQAPSEASDAYFEVLTNSRVVDAVADLIGPDVRHHHNKINSKQPGSSTEVRWHQDFCFTPHTNCDLITALLFVDDVTEENGPLEVHNGSHRGP